jgi:spore germination protein GerM
VTGARHRAHLAAVCLGLLALAGCGVPVSGSPRALSVNDLPPPQAAVTTTTAPADYLKLTIVFLGTNGQPTPVSRYAAAQQDRLSTALGDLFQGPVGNEILLVTTAIPGPTQLLRVTPDPPANTGPPSSGPVIVNLSGDFLATSGPNQVLAVEQVVLTVACYLGAATQVSFEVEGIAQPVPIGTGSSPGRPVKAADYVSLPLNCGP